MTKELWNRFDRIVVFDTETTGIDFDTDRIIELGAVALEKEGETGSLNCLIRLPQGHRLPPFIVDLTGITDEELAQKGVSEEEAGAAFCHLLEGAKRPLLVAYNAQFDLNFLYWFLKKSGNAQVLRLPRFLDALTVYKDRRDYPHKLCNAIEVYGLSDQVVNSHRAVDDVIATVAVTLEMEKEREDLENYVNLFGYHAKFGLDGKPIGSVTYKPQQYDPPKPLYEM